MTVEDIMERERIPEVHSSHIVLKIKFLLVYKLWIAQATNLDQWSYENVFSIRWEHDKVQKEKECSTDLIWKEF